MNVQSKEFQKQLKKEVAKLTNENEKPLVKQEAKISKDIENPILDLTNHEISLIISALISKRTRVLEVHFSKYHKIEHEDQIDLFADVAKDLMRDINKIIDKLQIYEKV